MNTFDHANQTLRRDLGAYVQALGIIVAALPQARLLCELVVKETRLMQALLAFATGPQIAELTQAAMRIGNLWPYRDRPYARTLGFSEEITEAKTLREEAQRAVKLLARHGNDTLASEVVECLKRIENYLSEEQRLLEECHECIQPHAHNMGMTRKRLNLLIAAVDARMPESAGQRATLRAYNAAAAILNDWENGVPLDENGVDILDRCMTSLEQADRLVLEDVSIML